MPNKLNMIRVLNIEDCYCENCQHLRASLMTTIEARGFGVQLVDGGNPNVAEIIHSNGRPVIVIHKSSGYLLWTMSHALMSLIVRPNGASPQAAFRIDDPVVAVSKQEH